MFYYVIIESKNYIKFIIKFNNYNWILEIINKNIRVKFM